MARVTLPTADISDLDTFHDVCARTLGFPRTYGRTMAAWVDCMARLDDRRAGMAGLTAVRGERLLLVVVESVALKARAPAVFDALVEGAAAVNQRCMQDGNAPSLALILT